MSRIEEALEKAAALRAPAVPPMPGSRKEARTDRPGDHFDVEPLGLFNTCLKAREDHPAAGEEYRKLRSQLIQLTAGVPFRNTLLLTSAERGEGKTVSALNMSMVLGREYDYTVLLVDADLRQPSVHEYLGITPEIGLIQVLKGEATVDQALIKTGHGKLTLLPAGGRVQDPVELLSSRRMRDLVASLKSRYPDRYVVIDSPPILPFADARVLGQYVDGILFVVRENWASFDQVREAMATLEETALLGVIYNAASRGGQNGSYHYYQA